MITTSRQRTAASSGVPSPTHPLLTHAAPSIPLRATSPRSSTAWRRTPPSPST
jgi:hypothetical protein